MTISEVDLVHPDWRSADGTAESRDMIYARLNPIYIRFPERLKARLAASEPVPVAPYLLLLL